MSARPLLHIPLLLVGLTAAGCQLFTGPLEKVELSVQRTERDVSDSPTAEVIVKVMNHATETVMIPFCGDRLRLALDGLGSDGWETLTTGLCPTQLQHEEPLASEGSVQSVYLLNLRGTFRFTLDVREPEGYEPKTVTSPVVEIQ